MRFNLAKAKGTLGGEPVFMIGNGPSLLEHDLSLLDGRFTIGSNRAFLAYDPTILVWQDRGMYKCSEPTNTTLEDIRKTQAIKICRDVIDDHKEFNTFKLNRGKYEFEGKTDQLRGFGCTGAIACQLAYALGAGSLILLGYDAAYKGEKTDFYGKNSDHKDHTLKNFETAYHFLYKKCPVPIVSCSDCRYWRKRSLKDVVKDIENPKRTRVFWYAKMRSPGV